MGIDHSNPYIHSTTVLCDINAAHLSHISQLSKKLVMSLKDCIHSQQTSICPAPHTWPQDLLGVVWAASVVTLCAVAGVAGERKYIYHSVEHMK